MRILLISQHYHPETTAAPLRLRPLAAGLAARGHRVEVVCQLPSHPQGAVYPGYRGRALMREELDGVRITYTWSYASPSKRLSVRMLNYATYAATATVVAGLAARPDVIFASSPPLTVGAVGELLARRFRVPWVLDVRDLWPEHASSLGAVSEGRLLKVASWLERHLYESASAITTVTEPFIDHIGSITDRAKVKLLPNGTTRAWLDLSETSVDRGPLGLPGDRFVWTYAGNVGLSQDLEVAVDAAGRLGEGFQLLILGEGASRERLRELAAPLGDGQVVFQDAVSAEQAGRVMRASDALLVSLSDDPVVAKTVPIKLYDSCAVGRPVLVAAPGEAQRLAESDGAGIAVKPGDPQALAEAVRRLAADSALREKLSASGVAFAASQQRELQVEPLERLLESVAAGRDR